MQDRKYSNSIHNEDTFSGRNDGRKQYPLTEPRWQLHKALLDRMIYAGRDDPPLNTFTPATVQMGDRPNRKKPSKVRTISDATHGNFHLHLLQQIPTSKVLYNSICSRRRVSRGKWMQFPVYVTVYSSDGADGFHQILKLLFISAELKIAFH